MARTIRIATVAVLILGMLLHFFTASVKAEGGLSSFSANLMFMAWVPYVVVAVVFIFVKNAMVPLGGALAAFGIDTAVYLSVFVWPQGSTAPLALLFMPYWNLLLFVPIGMLVGWGISKYLWRKQSAL